MAAKEMYYKLKLSLRDQDGPFMGIGLVRLLEGIEEHKSIRKAAGSMNMSYPKALRIIRRLEEALGAEVVVTARGGPKGGGAQVTESGWAIVRRFEAFHRTLKQEADALYESIFPDRKPL